MSDKNLLAALNRKLAQTEDPDRAAALQARIDDLTDSDNGDEDDGGDNLNRKTKAELVEMAEDLDVDVTGMTKSQIITALEGDD